MMIHRIGLWASFSLASVLFAADVARAQCLDWKPGFGQPGGGVTGGAYASVLAQTVFDDGTTQIRRNVDVCAVERYAISYR